MAVPPAVIREILAKFEARFGCPGTPLVIVTSAAARYFLRQIAEASYGQLFFISHSEVRPDVRVISLGVISWPGAPDQGTPRERITLTLKSYFAGTVEAGLGLARNEMRPEAVLVSSIKTKAEVKHLGGYEVTFARLPDAGAQAPGKRRRS